MNISNLNVRITFQKNDVVIDKIGNHTNSWEDYFSCYATVSGENGSEQAVVGETVEINVIILEHIRRYSHFDVPSAKSETICFFIEAK